MLTGVGFHFVLLHDLTPQIINELNNSATKIWSDLHQPETQLDIDLQITDFPKEQLAEATITGFDENGVPNAETQIPRLRLSLKNYKKANS